MSPKLPASGVFNRLAYSPEGVEKLQAPKCDIVASLPLYSPVWGSTKGTSSNHEELHDFCNLVAREQAPQMATEGVTD